MELFESILLHDGTYHHLDLHQARVNKAFQQFASEMEVPDLADVLPKIQLAGKYKVRFMYDLDNEEATFNIEYAEYVPRVINSMEVVTSDDFDYSMKYADRSKINQLAESSKADDIIISINGMVTDGSYFNLAFSDGSNWFTPKTHLLNGVRRQHLIQTNKIQEVSIRNSDLKDFEQVSLINAMLDLGELTLPTSAIVNPKNDG